MSQNVSTPPASPTTCTQANYLYVAVTRAKRRLVLNPTLARQLQQWGMWDSLACRGLSSDPALCGLPAAPCRGYGCDCTDAHGVTTENASAAGGGGGGDVSRTPRLLFAGSGSMAPLCRACVEGAAGEEGNQGKFPYAGALLAPPPPGGSS